MKGGKERFLLQQEQLLTYMLNCMRRHNSGVQLFRAATISRAFVFSVSVAHPHKSFQRSFPFAQLLTTLFTYLMLLVQFHIDADSYKLACQEESKVNATAVGLATAVYTEVCGE